MLSFKVGPDLRTAARASKFYSPSTRNRGYSVLRGVPPPPPQPDAKRRPSPNGKAGDYIAERQASAVANRQPTMGLSESRYRIFCGTKEIFSTLDCAPADHVVKGSICSSALRLFPEYFMPLHMMLSAILSAVSWNERLDLTWRMLPWALKLPDEAVGRRLGVLGQRVRGWQFAIN